MAPQQRGFIVECGYDPVFPLPESPTGHWRDIQGVPGPNRRYYHDGRKELNHDEEVNWGWDNVVRAAEE